MTSRRCIVSTGVPYRPAFRIDRPVFRIDRLAFRIDRLAFHIDRFAFHIDRRAELTCLLEAGETTICVVHGAGSFKAMQPKSTVGSGGKD